MHVCNADLNQTELKKLEAQATAGSHDNNAHTLWKASMSLLLDVHVKVKSL